MFVRLKLVYRGYTYWQTSATSHATYKRHQRNALAHFASTIDDVRHPYLIFRVNYINLKADTMNDKTRVY